MLTLTPTLGYAVARFGRLTLTSRDYATCPPSCECDDGEEYNLHSPADRRDLLLRHGHDAADLVSRWRYESVNDGAEQREAAAEMWHEYHLSRGVNL